MNHLPRLLLTHGDLRHVGGIYDLDKEFGIGEVFASSFRFRSAAYRRIFTDMQREPSRLRTIHRNDTAGPWRVLHPTPADDFPQADDGALVLTGRVNAVNVVQLGGKRRSRVPAPDRVGPAHVRCGCGRPQRPIPH